MQTVKNIERGHIYKVDLGEQNGSIQGGVRPFLVTSNELNNKYSPIINGCPISSKLGKNSLPVHVLIEGCGLSKKSLILVEQLTPINKSQIISYIGQADELTMKRVAKAVDIQLEKRHVEGVRDDIFRVRMFGWLRNKIIEILKDIRGLERNLYETSSPMARRIILEESGHKLEALEKLCKDNGFDYRSFYHRYEKDLDSDELVK